LGEYNCHTFFEKMCRKKLEDPDRGSYRKVQELKAAGIQLKCNKNSCLRNISFNRLFSFYLGYLLLPPITVDDSTGPKFMNLIASEMCPNHCKCILRNVQTSRIKDFIYLYICNFFGGSGEGKAQSRVDLLAFTCICPSKH
jgi:hypothetical protein